MDIRRLNLSLLLVSILMLFTEMVLIRWLSTESRIFAYVNNLVLLACFLGIGMGAYFAKRTVRLWLTPAALATILVMIQAPLSLKIDGESLHLFRDVPVLLSAFTDSVIWYETTQKAMMWKTLLGMVSVLAIFVTVLISVFPLGQVLGRDLDSHPRTIAAYSLNVFASIVGVWALAAISFFYGPPLFWFVLVVGLYLALLLVQAERSRLDYIAAPVLLVVAVGLLMIPGAGEPPIRTVWSPYQKLDVHPMEHRSLGVQRGYLLNVNEVGYMGLLDLSDSFVTRYPALFTLEDRQYSQYDIPYQFKPDAREVLILGAGAGNDAAGALRHGVERVDAVEIDPGIYAIGREFHPERPYDNPRVHVIIDDARAYLDQTDRSYDVVSVGLLDAHTLSSSYNNTRIDHYVYTEESLRRMRDRLKPDGILTVAFEARRPWIRQRLYDLLERVFGHAPEVLAYRHGQYGFGGTMYVVGRDADEVQSAIAANPQLKQFVTLFGSRMGLQGDSIKPTTDDWPYLYLHTARIPNMHLSIMAILGVMVAGVGRIVVRRTGALDWHFFFLGAAFLLMEFQNISKASLLLGSTWLVNSVIITGILVLVLLANLFVHRYRVENLRWVYAVLLVSLVAIWLVPLSLFNTLSFWPRAILGTAFLNLPVFFGGIIFITSFRKTAAKDQAFGSNLLGAAVGGVMESLSFVVGINALVLLAALFYVLAMVKARR